MFSKETINKAYKNVFGGSVVEHWLFSALDPEIFKQETEWSQRPLDVGYRRYKAPAYTGHRERETLAELFSSPQTAHLKKDISMRNEDRLDTQSWAHFLNRCKFILGSEAGGSYFDPTDTFRLKVNRYCSEHPDHTWQNIEDHFLGSAVNVYDGRIAPSSLFEAAGTGTGLILYEGQYSGVLKANTHYLPLKKDHSNLTSILEQMKDNAIQEMIDRVHRHVLKHHTYNQRIQELESIINRQI